MTIFIHKTILSLGSFESESQLVGALYCPRSYTFTTAGGMRFDLLLELVYSSVAPIEILHEPRSK